MTFSFSALQHTIPFLYLEILEFETSLWDSVHRGDPGEDTDVAEEDTRSCNLLLLFFRALLQLCPALKRVHVTLLSEADSVRFIIHIAELERMVTSSPCIHIENLFFLGRHAVIRERNPPPPPPVAC